jgi:hypothetical protein
MREQPARLRLPALGSAAIRTFMKTPISLFGILTACLLSFTGCSKSDAPAPGTGEALTIDATQLRPAFANASPEVKAIVDKVMMSVQASALQDALAGLDKLASTPDLTEPQKKVVASLTDQIKRKLAAAAPKPGQ